MNAIAENLSGKSDAELRAMYLSAITQSKFDNRMKGMALIALNLAPADTIRQIAALVDRARIEKNPAVFDKMLADAGLPQAITESIHAALKNLVQ